MYKYKVHKTFLADNPINDYKKNVEMHLTCELNRNHSREEYYFSMLFTYDLGGVIGTHSISSNDVNKQYVIKYFSEYSHLLKWLNWTVKGPIHYDFLKDTLEALNSKAEEPIGYKDFFVVEGIPLLYKLDANLISYIKHNGVSKLKGTTVKTFVCPHNSNVRSLHSIGNYADEWKNAPFETAVEAQAFLNTINNHCTDIRSVIVKFSGGKTPNINKAKELALLNKITDKSFTEKNLKKRLTLLIRNFKKDMINIGLNLC